MKFNFNGNVLPVSENILSIDNRALMFGDLIKERIRVSNHQILFWEEHYFNLMASMRILRMQIPNTFTPEFLQSEVSKVISENNIPNAIVDLIVFRENNSESLITEASVSFCIRIHEELNSADFNWINEAMDIDIYKDFSIHPSLFSQLNTPKSEDLIAWAYLQENEFGDLVLLNTEKQIARTLKGNIFLIQGDQIKTTKLENGGIKSILRNNLCKKLAKNTEFKFEETEIFPFELQKTDEVFICIEGFGIQSVHQNRKKSYTTEKTAKVLEILNS